MIISVENLNVSYKDVHAVQDVSFDIEENEIFGLIGHNGAGKTTILECMEGLHQYYSGSISVMGLDPQTERKALNRLIGVQLQETMYQDRIRVNEICRLFQSFYKESADFEELLVKFGLDSKRRAYIGKLSGGQRQRLSIILALMGKPKILFLDEITTGLDPIARREIWDVLKALKEEGMTIVLTTHYMEEAEELCDRVCVLNQGQIVCQGSVRELVDMFDLADTVVFSTDSTEWLSESEIEGLKWIHKGKDGSVYITGDSARIVGSVTAISGKKGHRIKDLKVTVPGLEEVYFMATGVDYEPYGYMYQNKNSRRRRV